jgi:pimeloyl-ACP methyl ester carboxylesterase
MLKVGKSTARFLPPECGTGSESYRAPESWARRAYPNLSYFHEVDKGGRFAAWEQPDLFAAELRAAFQPLRR